MTRIEKDCRSEFREKKARGYRLRLECGVRVRVNGASCKGFSVRAKMSRLGEG